MAISSFQSLYAERSDAILLVVIPAAQAPEVASAKAIRIAKELDGECRFAGSILSWFIKLRGGEQIETKMFSANGIYIKICYVSEVTYIYILIRYKNCWSD